MTWLMVVAGASGWFVAVVLLLVLPSRARRRSLMQALRLRAQVVPYLQRRALEAGIDTSAQLSTHDAEEIVDHLCLMAGRLSEQERSQVELGDTVNLAVSDTMPIDTTGLEQENEE